MTQNVVTTMTSSTVIEVSPTETIVISSSQGPRGPSGPSGHITADWGSIEGTITDQLDLVAQLDSKAASNHNHDGVYQPAGSYAAANHNHDGVYQPAGSYAAASHNHTASGISDFNESVDDRVASLLVGGPNIEIAYSDVGNTLTINGVEGVNGFPTDASGNYFVDLTYNETTRTITLTPTGSTFDLYSLGVKYTFTGPQSIQHGTTQGGHFIYMDESGTIVTSTTPWNTLRHCYIAYVFWDATNNLGIPFDERHHMGRDVYWHRNQHAAEGTKVTGSGFIPSGFTLNAGNNNNFVTYAISSGRVEDEDIRIDTETLPDNGNYTIMYRSGGSGDWVITRTNTLPYAVSGNTIQYNRQTGTWSLANVPEDNYVNYWVFVTTALPRTSITPTPASTQQFIIIPGQSVYTTETAAHSESPASLAWGNMPFQEIAPLFQVTMLHNATGAGNFSTTGRCAITRLVRVAGSYSSIVSASQTDHGALVGLTDDDHPQYHTDARGDARYMLNNGGSAVEIQSLTFDQTNTETPAVGKLYWNDVDGTINIGLKGGQVVLQLGQEQVIRVLNKTGNTLLNSRVVYATSAQGHRIEVVYAQANSELTSSKTLAVLTEDIANNQEGFGTTHGLVRDIDTSSLTEGGAVWLSPTVAGGLTSTRPSAPNHAVFIGWCTHQHATQGSIFVHIQNGYELEELHDVLISSPQAGQVVRHNGTTWTNQHLPIFESFTRSGELTVSAGNSRWYPPQNCTINQMEGWVGTAPTGSSLFFSVKKNGVSVATGTIASGQFLMTPTLLSIPLLTTDYISVDVTQVGSTVPGSDLYVRLRAI